MPIQQNLENLKPNFDLRSPYCILCITGAEHQWMYEKLSNEIAIPCHPIHEVYSCGFYICESVGINCPNCGI